MLETGDPLIDKWERELAMGIEPDLLDGMSDEYRRKVEGKSVAEAETIIPEFNDDYSTMISDSGGLLGQ